MKETKPGGTSGPQEPSSPNPEIDRILQTTSNKIVKHQARLELLETLEDIARRGGNISVLTAGDPGLAVPLSFWRDHAEEIVRATRPHALEYQEAEKVTELAKKLFEKYLEGVRNASPDSLKDTICRTQETIIRLAKIPIEEGANNAAAQRQTKKALTGLRKKLKITST